MLTVRSGKWCPPTLVLFLPQTKPSCEVLIWSPWGQTLSWCCCHRAYCDAASVHAFHFLPLISNKHSPCEDVFSLQTEFLSLTKKNRIFPSGHVDEGFSGSRLNMHVLNCFCKTFVYHRGSWHDVRNDIWGPRHQGPSTPVQNELVGWSVGGRGGAGVPHYAVDYPLLSTATVKLLSPLLWG